jgi:hypothetical protein
MPKVRPPPIVLTLQQQIHSWRQRAQTLRMIAASSHDATVRRNLIERAESWERRARAAEEGETKD